MATTLNRPASRHSTADPLLSLPPELMCPRALAPFLRKTPLPVLVRSCLEWMLAQANLEELFEQTARQQYTRELTLSVLVDLMLEVACGTQPSAHAALAARREQILVSRQAFYAKLQRMELPISEALVTRFAGLAGQIMGQWGRPGTEPIPGYQARVLDGIVLGGRTEHRIEPLRTTRAAGLTGKGLAVFQPAQGHIGQIVLDEDAYTQERALVGRVQVQAGEVWFADRNFCVRTFLFRVQRQQAAFIVRWHSSSCPYECCAPTAPASGSTQGALEQPVLLVDPDTGEVMPVRRIVLPLATPTRNGDRELVLLTNLPASVSADAIGDAYRARWQIEVHFQRLTQQLHCEPAGFDHPRAALFAFAIAVVAGIALAVVQAALRVAHGEEPVRELSYYAFVLQVSQIWPGLSVAVPDEQWQGVRCASLETLAAWLLALARQVDMERFRRQRRGPKKPQPKKQKSAGHHHFSNKRLLDAALDAPYNSH